MCHAYYSIKTSVYMKLVPSVSMSSQPVQLKTKILKI